MIGLEALGIHRVEHALTALGLMALPLLLAARALRLPPRALAWPAWDEARASGASRREPARWLAVALRLGCLCLLALALGDPQSFEYAAPEAGRGIDILMVVDASHSMRALDTNDGMEQRSRLSLARQVVARFAAERAASGDRVGLVVFGAEAFTQCPLTSDGRLLAASLGRLEAGIAGDATAIGDALALSIRRLETGTGAAKRDDIPSPPGVIVLLSDGRSNAGRIPLGIAAEIARARGVRVHTVAIGSGSAPVAMAADATETGSRHRFERHDVDAARLQSVASTTGGRFFPARSPRDLAAIYREIDALERHPRPLPPRIRSVPHPEPLLAAAGGLLAFEIALARVLRRPMT